VVLDQFTVVYAFCLAFMSLQVLLVLALFMDACQARGPGDPCPPPPRGPRWRRKMDTRS